MIWVLGLNAAAGNRTVCASLPRVGYPAAHVGCWNVELIDLFAARAFDLDVAAADGQQFVAGRVFAT